MQYIGFVAGFTSQSGTTLGGNSDFTRAVPSGGKATAAQSRTSGGLRRFCLHPGAKPDYLGHCSPVSHLVRRLDLASPASPPHEPILTLPGALTAYIALLAAIHGVREFLPFELDAWTIEMFGFIPKRYDQTLLAMPYIGGTGAKIWTFVTYSLLHANLSHIGFNILWLLPFGSALARRFGAARFYLFMAVTAVAGAFAHLLTHEHELAPMIGASASVSGAMAAAIRFAFVKGSFLSFNRGDAEAAARVPALSLVNSLINPRVLGFVAIWFGVNIIFGVGSLAIGTDGASVAWQAHIGGFVAGLLLFSLFDPISRQQRRPADI